MRVRMRWPRARRSVANPSGPIQPRKRPAALSKAQLRQCGASQGEHAEGWSAREEEEKTGRTESAETQFAGVERLCEAGGGIAFHAPQTRQRQEEILGKPVPAGLGREMFQQQRRLLAQRRLGDGHETVGLADVAVVLRNL